jgi:6-phosphofructokinase 1
MLGEDLVDLCEEPMAEVEAIPFTPGAIFGSCRRRLKSDADFERLFQVIDAHDIGYFFYNGGNDSMETAHAVATRAAALGLPLRVIGIPKTVDNDLVGTDHCPGFGSSAKYTAIAVLETMRDLQSMAADSTQVFILESMGRHAGWLAAASALASYREPGIPHLILLPEVPFVEEKFLSAVDDTLRKHGFCTIVAAEALKGPDGQFVSTAGYGDAFGNVQLGKVGLHLERCIRSQLDRRVHTALPDYLQRSSRHIASYTDFCEAQEVGRKAVRLATEGHTDCMVSIDRVSHVPYVVRYDAVPLEMVAGKTKVLPAEFILEGDGFHVTEALRAYVAPLIRGEAPNLWMEGLPRYAHLSGRRVPCKLDAFET